MNKLLACIAMTMMVMLFGSPLLAQRKTEPFPGCSTILIETRVSGVAAFGSWSRHLESQGVRLDRTDPMLLQLNTLPVSIKKMDCEYFIESQVTDNGNVLVNLKWRTLTPDSITHQRGEFQKWTYSDTKKSVSFTLYNELMRVVDLYTTQPWFLR